MMMTMTTTTTTMIVGVVVVATTTITITISTSNNSIQFFIISVPSQQPQGQLQTQHSVEKNNYFMNKHNIKSKTN
jgi:predicted sulfurtransferase